MKKILILLLGVLMLSSCNKDDVINTPDNATTQVEGIKLYAQKSTPQAKAVELKNNRWEVGETIKIKFLNGTTRQKDFVKEYSVEWLNYANLNFVFLEDDSEDADVKIGFNFNGDEKTWSYVGTDARNIPQNAPSLNFGRLSALASRAKIDIYMQFGHVLGLVNEHQGPESGIVLDKELTYEYFMYDEGWSVQEIDDFFFKPYTDSETNYTEYDPKSIMVWPIIEDLIISGDIPSANRELSEIDKEFVAAMYPKEFPLIHVKFNMDYSHFFAAYPYPNFNDFQIDWATGKKEPFRADGSIVMKRSNAYLNGTYRIYGPKESIHSIVSTTPIMSLDIKNCSEILSVSVQGSFRDLDLSQNKKLESLDAYSGMLFDIDLSNNTELKFVSFGTNQLSELNFSNNKKLNTILISPSAQILNETAMVNMANTLPDRTSLEPGVIKIGRQVNPNIIEWIGAICQAKNWNLTTI